jgi:ribosome biogenesis GTPase A
MAPPLSGKQKKAQLQEKRHRKAAQAHSATDGAVTSVVAGGEPSSVPIPRFDSHRRVGAGENLDGGHMARRGGGRRGGAGGGGGGGGRPPKMARDTEEKQRDRAEAAVPVRYLEETTREMLVLGYSECGKSEDPREFLPLPMRPPWHKDMSLEALARSEERAYAAWLSEVEGRPGINFFEHNIETWRQLWRVCERSDIVVQVVDARFPLLLSSDALWSYVCVSLGKPMIIVLNKCDLVPRACVEAWVAFLEARTPGTHVVAYKSPQATFKGTRARSAENLRQTRRFLRFVGGLEVTKGGRKVRAKEFFDPDHILTAGLDADPTLDDRGDGGNGEDGGGDGDGESDDDEGSGSSAGAGERGASRAAGAGEEGELREERAPIGLPEDSKKHDTSLMLGFVGNPNVGKSSMINSIFAKKLVSYSRTPGHTKHFQTLFLQKRLQVCDSPGVVFPAQGTSRDLQVLAGLYPVAQLRKPFPVIRYLAERCVPRLHEYYHLPAAREPPNGWSPFTLCEVFSDVKGYHTKGGACDVSRAANHILRFALNGFPPLLTAPPGTPSGSEARRINLDEMIVKIAKRNKDEGNRAKARRTELTAGADDDGHGRDHDGSGGSSGDRDGDEDQEEDDGKWGSTPDTPSYLAKVRGKTVKKNAFAALMNSDSEQESDDDGDDGSED